MAQVPYMEYIMELEALVHDTLKTHFDEECEFAGASNTADIVRHVLAGKSVEDISRSAPAGYDSDLTEAITVIAAVTVIARNAIEIFKAASAADRDADERARKEKEAAEKLKCVIDAMRMH